MSFEIVKDINVKGITLPNTYVSNVQLIGIAKKLRIPNFRGVFVRDNLPKKPRAIECGILNLDYSNGDGTHWTAWMKKNRNENIYFDSYCKCNCNCNRTFIKLWTPSSNRTSVFLKRPVYYNSERIQPDNEVFCGHLCLYVLKEISDGRGFQNVINSLY